MTQVKRFWPLLTGIHRYEKTLSTRGHGTGVIIEAPILAYLIETSNGRILYDVGCDYHKIADSGLRGRYYEHDGFPFGPPQMLPEDRLPNRLAQLGLQPLDVDVVCVGHLHFDHGGGLQDLRHAEIHVHRDELAAAREYDLVPGVRAIESPGHTAGHMSMLVELPKGAPILLAGDAADLAENLDEEIAPGLCWQDREDLALASIRKLKRLAYETGAELWPNHDMNFYRGRRRFPLCYE